MKQAVPSHPHGQKITEIFNYGWRWIETPNEEGSTEWKTNTKYKIKPRVLWAKHQDANTIVGVRFGSSTSYAMIDIDKGSDYNDPYIVSNIRGALETIGICRTIILRSSWSGGLHIYLPLPQNYPTFSVACAVSQALEAQGYKVSPGQLEVFPNTKAFGKFWEKQFIEYNGHRLPLQPGTGSCLLDDDLEPIPDCYNLAQFLGIWENSAQLNDHEEFAEALCVARRNRKRNRKAATGPAAEWKADLEAVIAEGWTGKGQTNALLKEIGTYGRVFEKIDDLHKLAKYIQDVAERSPGYIEFCDHTHEIERRSTQWAMSVAHYYWPLGSTPLRDRTRPAVNARRAEEARDRICAALAEIGDRTALTISELVKQLCKLAYCSAQTLYKNRDLWHPQGTPEPAQTTNEVTMPVMDDIPSDSATIESLRAIVRRSLGMPDIASVTHHPPHNEVWNLKSSPLKNLHSKGKEGGAGGEKGYPQAPPPPKPVDNPSPGSGWLPNLNWKQGAVGDV